MTINVSMTKSELESLQAALTIAYVRAPKYQREHINAANAFCRKAADLMTAAEKKETERPPNERLAEAIFGKALGCCDCDETFPDVITVEQHARLTGHNVTG